MPVYDYYCESCHQISELLQKFSDPVATDCPHCRQPHLKKQVSAPAFQLKGSGWYVTDFKDNKPKETAQTSEKTTVVDTPKEAPTTTAVETKKSD